jgi:hypothetical protein
MNTAHAVPATYLATPSSRTGRMQVYSNRPLRCYGYVCPNDDGTFGIAVGDVYEAWNAPATGSYKTKTAAKRALVEVAR